MTHFLDVKMTTVDGRVAECGLCASGHYSNHHISRPFGQDIFISGTTVSQTQFQPVDETTNSQVFDSIDSHQQLLLVAKIARQEADALVGVDKTKINKPPGEANVLGVVDKTKTNKPSREAKLPPLRSAKAVVPVPSPIPPRVRLSREQHQNHNQRGQEKKQQNQRASTFATATAATTSAGVAGRSKKPKRPRLRISLPFGRTPKSEDDVVAGKNLSSALNHLGGTVVHTLGSLLQAPFVSPPTR
jgi:hypothetical protein